MNENEQNNELEIREDVVMEAPVEGKPVEENTVLEQEAPAEALAEVVKKPKGIKKPIIILGVVAAVVAVAVTVVSLILNMPMNLLSRGFKKSISAINKSEMAVFCQKLANGGSTEIVANLEEMTDIDGTVSAKIYTNAKEKKSVVQASAKIDNKEVDAALYANEDGFAIGSEWLLGDSAYGIGAKDLATRFNKSAFGINGEYSLGFEMPEDYNDAKARSEQLNEDTNALMESIGKKLIKTLHEEAEIEKESSSVSLGDKTVKTTAVKVSLDDEQFVNVLAEMLEYADEDEQLRTYLEDNAKYFLGSGIEAVDPDEVDDFIDDFYDALDDGEDALDDLADELDDVDFSITITFHINKFNGQMIGIDFIIRADGEAVKFHIHAGPNLKQIREIEAKISGDGESYVASYKIEDNDSKKFESVLLVEADEEEVFRMKIRWDKKDEAFKISVDDGYETSYLRGTFQESDEKVKIHLDEFESEYRGETETTDLDITVTLLASDEMPEMPEFTDILDMSARELEKLAEDIMRAAQDSAERIMI